MKIYRLLGITIYLLNNKKTSAKILSDKFEVSIRTIQRDIETLCQAGIPVASSVGVDGGYEILDSFKMNRQIAGENDYAYIISALQGLASAYKSQSTAATLEKVKAVLRKDKRDLNIILDFSTLSENKNINEKLKLLESIIAEKYSVSFEYTNADNITTIKQVEPIALTYRWYSWYLLGYSLKKEDYRLYKILRMMNLKKINSRILRKHESAHILLEKNEAKDIRKYIDIKLFAKCEIKMKAIEYLNGSIEAEYENGDFIMNLHVPENEQFWLGTILSFGNLAKIIEPEQLKRKLCARCDEILNLYT